MTVPIRFCNASSLYPSTARTAYGEGKAAGGALLDSFRPAYADPRGFWPM
jgi:hypothetical protein